MATAPDNTGAPARAPSIHRRGLLGWLAAAPVVAAAVQAPAQTAEDWQTKPVERWTKLDFLAEAEHHVARFSDRVRQAPRNRASAVALDWWQRELVYIKQSIATALPMGGRA